MRQQGLQRDLNEERLSLNWRRVMVKGFEDSSAHLAGSSTRVLEVRPEDSERDYVGWKEVRLREVP